MVEISGLPGLLYIFLAVLTSSSQNATRVRSESVRSGLNRPALLRPSMSRGQLPRWREVPDTFSL